MKHSRTQADWSQAFRPGMLLGAVLLVGCSGGSPITPPTGTDTTPTSCTGSCATPMSNLTAADVQQVIAQGVAEAQARNANATIAVVDRVGNVLAVYRMGFAGTRSVT